MRKKLWFIYGFWDLFSYPPPPPILQKRDSFRIWLTVKLFPLRYGLGRKSKFGGGGGDENVGGGGGGGGGELID